MKRLWMVLAILGRLSLIIGISGSIGYFIYQQNLELQRVYSLIENISISCYYIEDLQVRTFHYTKPHNPYDLIYKDNGVSTNFCKECWNIIREMEMDLAPYQFVAKEEYYELQRIKREYNKIINK